MRFSRRVLLLGAAALGLLPLRAQASGATATDALLALLDDRKTAATLGGNWLQKQQEGPADVVANLQTSLQRYGWTGDVGKLRTVMSSAIADDFRAGAVVTIDGWQIARTQAELCALAYFAETGRL